MDFICLQNINHSCQIILSCVHSMLFTKMPSSFLKLEKVQLFLNSDCGMLLHSYYSGNHCHIPKLNIPHLELLFMQIVDDTFGISWCFLVFHPAFLSLRTLDS